VDGLEGIETALNGAGGQQPHQQQQQGARRRRPPRRGQGDVACRVS
jgi:hypothetical protein